MPLYPPIQRRHLRWPPTALDRDVWHWSDLNTRARRKVVRKMNRCTVGNLLRYLESLTPEDRAELATLGNPTDIEPESIEARWDGQPSAANETEHPAHEQHSQ